MMITVWEETEIIPCGGSNTLKLLQNQSGILKERVFFSEKYNREFVESFRET